MLKLNKITNFLLKLKHINKNNWFDVRLLGLCFFIFFLPINQRISTLFLLFNVFLAIIYIRYLNLKMIKKFLLLFLLYMFYVFSNYRDEYKFGFFLFERKASLIAFPLIFSTYKISKKRLLVILKSFAIGCLVAYFLFLFNALYNTISFNPFSFNPVSVVNEKAISPLISNYFLGQTFAFSSQSSLIAILFSFSIGIVLYCKKLFSKTNRMIIVLCLSAGVIQIFGVVGIISWLIVLFIKIKHFKFTIITILFLFLTSLFFVQNFSSSEVYNQAKKLDDRVIIWDTAIKVIKTNFFIGNGTKKAQKELENKYPKSGDFGAVSQLRKLDAHNIYLQIFIELGVVGFILLIAILGNFYFHLKRLDLAMLFFMLLILLSLTESILNIYSGLAFFSFFYCLYLNNNSVANEEN